MAWGKVTIDETIPPPPTEEGGTDESIEDFGDSRVKFKFKRLKDRRPGESWILLVYGPAKAGKTYFAGTAGGRTLFINCGEGLETLHAPAFTSKHGNIADEMITVDVREVANQAEAFDMVCDALDHALKHFPDKFDTVVIDEATALRKFALNKAIQLTAGQATKVDRQSRNRLENYTKADIGDFGIEMDMINWFLGTYIPIFKSMGKHFIMLAHERQIFNKPAKVGDEPTLKRVLPGFTGKTFPDQVPAFFDDVWRMEVVSGGVHRIRTKGDEQEMGGSRHGGIFKDVEQNPNFLEMLNRIQNSHTKR